MSPRWLRTCTAVVGSLTAGESALIAMSTITRIANAGSCSIVRSTPSTIIDRRRLSADGVQPSPPYTSSSAAPSGTKSPTAGRTTIRQSCARAKRASPRASIAWTAPARRVATTKVGGVSPTYAPGQVRRRVGPLGLPDHGLERASAGLGDERGDRDGPQPVNRAIQEHEEEENPGREEESGERHAEARHRVLLRPAGAARTRTSRCRRGRRARP